MSNKLSVQNSHTNGLCSHTSIDTFIRNQLSEHTRQAYEHDLRHFKAFLRAPLLEVDTSVLIEYREYLRARYAASTVNRRLSTVRSLFTWLKDAGAIGFNPAQSVKLLPGIDNANTKALSDTEVAKLLEASKANPMHFAMVSMLCYLGLRRSELTALTWECIEQDRNAAVLKVFGKGSKWRRVPLPEPVVEALKPLRVATTRLLECTYIFPAKSGNRMDSKQVWRIVRRYCKRSGITVVSPHSLRATACSNAIDQGSNFVELQYAFGWQSPAMVNRYDKRRGEIKNSAIWKINYKTGEKS